MRTMDRERLLLHLQGAEERAIGARLVDLAERALRDDRPLASDFLDPLGQKIAQSILGSIPEVSYRAYGGYPKAERRRLLIFPEYDSHEEFDEPIAALDLTLESKFDGAGHRDCLGAILGTGLERDKVGDIIVTSRGFQAVVAVEVADFLLTHLTHVGKIPVTVERIDPERLEVPPERVKEIRATVASLRLDAVASLGFGVSRTRMAREIKGERVKLNWKTVRDPAHSVAQGDTLSIRGRGRVVVEEVQGTTRKGRISLLLKRYV